MSHPTVSTVDQPLPGTDMDTPYAGTSGWSGTDTSHERAIAEDTSGTTTRRHALTLGSLHRAGTRGLTWHELSEQHAWHHGQASGALSVLHKTGRIARLTERRGKSKVYVHIDYVAGRETEPYGSRTGRTEREDKALAYAREALVAAYAAIAAVEGDQMEADCD